MVIKLKTFSHMQYNVLGIKGKRLTNNFDTPYIIHIIMNAISYPDNNFRYISFIGYLH